MNTVRHTQAMSTTGLTDLSDWLSILRLGVSRPLRWRFILLCQTLRPRRPQRANTDGERETTTARADDGGSWYVFYKHTIVYNGWTWMRAVSSVIRLRLFIQRVFMVVNDLRETIQNQ